MENQSYSSDDINIEQAKAIRAALEKMCYELAPQPLSEELTKDVSYQLFPASLSLKELKQISLLAEKYDLLIVELAKAYKKLREIYWEDKLYFKHNKGNDYDFLKDIGVKW